MASVEFLALTVPVQVQPGASTFRVWQLALSRAHPDNSTDANITVTLRETDGTGAFLTSGRRLVCRYDGPVAEGLIGALNTANLSVTSLEKRILLQCQADDKLGTGTITTGP